MQQPIEFRKIREFGEIISDTFLFIKQNFKPLMKAYLYLCGLFVLGGMLSSLVANLQLVGLLDGKRAAELDNPITMMMNLSFNYIMILVFSVLAYTSYFVSVLSYIALYIRKGNVAPTVQEVWSYFKFYFFRVMGSGFLITCFWAICCLLCLLPGIWVTPALSIFFCIMVIENGGVGYAFNRCFKLVSDEWWITFATLVVVYVIFQGASLFIQIPTIALVWAKTFTHVETPFTVGYSIVSSVTQYLASAFLIIPIVSCALIYFNLVERKESTGLLEKISAFGEKPVQNFTPEEY